MSSKGSFAFSQLDEQDDEIESKDAFDPRPKTHRAFKDESDVEDDVSCAYIFTFPCNYGSKVENAAIFSLKF